MPTTNRALFDRTARRSVAVNQPPPKSQLYPTATTFHAVLPWSAHFYTDGVQRRLLIIYTDGESSQVASLQTHAQRRKRLCSSTSGSLNQIYSNNADPRYVLDQQRRAQRHRTDHRRFSAFPEGDRCTRRRACISRDAYAHLRVCAHRACSLVVLGCIVPSRSYSGAKRLRGLVRRLGKELANSRRQEALRGTNSFLISREGSASR
jgi:hypothetical protein